MARPRAPWSEEAVRSLVDELPPSRRLILPALQAVQGAFGYVDDAVVPVVAEALNVSRAEVHGVLTFYSDLRTSPPPAVEVLLCGAEACQAVGSRELAAHVEDRYGHGESDLEVREVFCLGNCALGPAAVVAGRILGRVDPAALDAAIAEAGVR